MIKIKIKDWIRRYLPAEIIGTVTALGAAGIFQAVWSNLVLSAFAGSFGEEIGFYSTLFFQNLSATVGKNRIENKKISVSDLSKTGRALFLEFGPALVLDAILLRPLFMYLFPILLNDFTAGILFGKIAGDITFYFMVIRSYELKKNRIKKSIC